MYDTDYPTYPGSIPRWRKIITCLFLTGIISLFLICSPIGATAPVEPEPYPWISWHTPSGAKVNNGLLMLKSEQLTPAHFKWYKELDKDGNEEYYFRHYYKDKSFSDFCVARPCKLHKGQYNIFIVSMDQSFELMVPACFKNKAEAKRACEAAAWEVWRIMNGEKRQDDSSP